jgi:hypothetical protein
MRLRLVSLCAVLVVSGCQCFVPVDEPDSGLPSGQDAGPDAGRDAGVMDAGVDPGPVSDGGCTTPTQCTGTQPTTRWCNTFVDAGFSCVEQACVWECPSTAAGRTCTVNQGSYCLECGDAGTACPQTGNTCGTALNVTATVEPDSSCTTWPGTTMPFTEVTLMRGASAQCRYVVSGTAQSLGEVWKLEGGDYVAFFPGFGGWCTGRSAFTGAARSIFSCPVCQFVLTGFE